MLYFKLNKVANIIACTLTMNMRTNFMNYTTHRKPKQFKIKLNKYKYLILSTIFPLVCVSLLTIYSHGVFAVNQTATININTSNENEMNEGLSGYNEITMSHGMQYNDDDYKSAAAYFKPGFIRFPAGTADNTFNWRTGTNEREWIAQFYNRTKSGNKYDAFIKHNRISTSKGGTKLSDFKTLLDYTGARAIIVINAYTDSPESAADLVEFSIDNHIQVAYYQLTNEPYFFTREDKTEYPNAFLTGTDYLDKMKPYYDAIKEVDPNAIVAIMHSERGDKYEQFDEDIASYSNKYWDAVSFHAYSGGNGASYEESIKTLNDSLDDIYHDVTNNIVNRNASDIPVLITEFNTATWTTEPDYYLRDTIYNGIYASEFITRLSTHPNVKHIGIHALSESRGGFVVKKRYNDELYNVYEQGSTLDTTGNDFQTYNAITGLALRLTNLAVNSSMATWATTVTGGDTVNISTGTIPALFAQAYKGIGGEKHLIITNKSGTAHDVTVYVDGESTTDTMTKEFITSDDYRTTNRGVTDDVAIQSETTSNSVTIPPYSVVRLEWDDSTLKPVSPLIKTATPQSTSSVKVKWAKLPGSTTYKVKYATSAGGPYTSIPVGDINEYTVTGLISGTTYYFRVAGHNGTEEGYKSDELTTQTSTPTQPEIISANPKLQAVTVEWENSDTATGYTLKWGTSSGNYTSSLDVGNVAGYTVRNLSDVTTYYFTVQAYNNLGDGATSAELSATPNRMPHAPHSLEVLTGKTFATVTWENAVSNYDQRYTNSFEEANAMNEWTTLAGTWSIVDDNSVSPGTKVMQGYTASGINSIVNDNLSFSDYDVELVFKVDSWTNKIGIIGRYQDSDNYYRMYFNGTTQTIGIVKVVDGEATSLGTYDVSQQFLNDIPANKWIRARFSMIGSHLTAYIKGSGSWLEIDDTTFSSGSYGLFTDGQQAAFDKVLVRDTVVDSNIVKRSMSSQSNYSTIATEIIGTSFVDSDLAPETTYYYKLQSVYNDLESVYDSIVATREAQSGTGYTFIDDFEDWNALDWTTGQNTWDVVTESSNKLYKATSSSGTSKSYFTVVPGADYLVRADIKVSSWTGRIGLMARYTDNANHYYMYYDSSDEKIYLVKRVSGVNTTLDISEALSAFATETDHDFKFVVVGDRLQGYVNDVLVTEASDSSLTSGKAGVYTQAQIGYFDNVSVNN
jgi:hypothetical protein